jgi:soluble lytic murein transglycosylase-like protein
MLHVSRCRRACPAAALLLLAWAPSARAELVRLTTGRTLSVQTHHFDGDRVTLVLRTGGEITCSASLVVRVDPDEVPYPEPAPEEPAPAPASPARLTGPYADVIARAAARHGVDPNLVHAVIRAESNYQPRARSPRGARGLMQLMPATLRDYQVGNPYDPASNIEAGVRRLKALVDRFPLAEALAAYNAGIVAVERYGGVPPFPETRQYVARVLGALRAAPRVPGR